MISYRYAVSNDVFDILNFDKEYFSNNFDEKFYIEYIENKKVLVAKEKDVVGYVLFNQIFDEAEIYKIVVSKDFRNKQIAYNLIEFLIKELKLRDVSKILEKLLTIIIIQKKMEL